MPALPALGVIDWMGLPDAIVYSVGSAAAPTSNTRVPGWAAMSSRKRPRGRTDGLLGMYLAELHPARKADGPPITVRVIEYTVHTSPADSIGDSDGGEEQTSEVFALVTDLLDVEAYPALDLACAYPMRWSAETAIGHHKTDMGEGMPVLRSKDPEGVAQEMWALFAVYQAIHTLIGAAINATGIPPEKISFPRH